MGGEPEQVVDMRTGHPYILTIFLENFYSFLIYICESRQ